MLLLILISLFGCVLAAPSKDVEKRDNSYNGDFDIEGSRGRLGVNSDTGAQPHLVINNYQPSHAVGNILGTYQQPHGGSANYHQPQFGDVGISPRPHGGDIVPYDRPHVASAGIYTEPHNGPVDNYLHETCGDGQEQDATGKCVDPIVNRNVYVFSAPELPVNYLPPPPIPQPKVNYNVVFVRTPDAPEELDPVVVPPPQEKTLVYVLTENEELQQQVIEVPTLPGLSPEVLYVNYDQGDDIDLFDGLSLREILAKEAKEGLLVGGVDGYGEENLPIIPTTGTNNDIY